VLLHQVDRWTLTELPRLNRAVLFDAAPPSLLSDELTGAVLPGLPAPEAVDPAQARRLLVVMGLVGASVARHRQERDPELARRFPERAFEGLPVGAARTPFRAYFARLADRTGTGHCHRDSYASLVRWNVGTTEVRWHGERLAILPGAFDDGAVRTYVGTPGEASFFELIKKGEAIELAINGLLAALADGSVAFGSADGVRRARVVTGLLDALRQLFRDFADLPPGEGMSPQFFMDVFRQFAVHWKRGDVPPSGALDPEALKRDFLLGIAIPGYRHHVQRVFPALLATERAALEAMMDRPTLPEQLLASLGVAPAVLRDGSPAQLHRLVGEHPVLGVWYRLLAAHARAAGAHLALTKKYLFKPQQHRDAAGFGDPGVVSNRRGTTGMDESLLERLTRARKDHILSPLRGIRSAEPAAPAGGYTAPELATFDPSTLVRIAGRAAVAPAGARPDRA
jgi:hypothetical protein